MAFTEIKTKDTEIPSIIFNKWQQIVDMMAELLNVPSAIVTRVSPPQIEVVQSALVTGNPYKGGDRVTMNGHYCESVVKTREKLQVSNAVAEPAWKNAPEIKYNMLAYLGFPVLWPDGEMFGTICVLDNKENLFGARYEKVLEQFRDVIESHLHLVQTNEELHAVLSELKILRGLLPVCSVCKKIRDETGEWEEIENYIRDRSGVEFSHGLCPACLEKEYPEYAQKA
ncbi:MAG: GAF domain-containing protein [Deltaproteobacteria bacterium]|nr:GAF domain-containing protein [Deltaproteobacteria bacterium]MBN2670756.1 GAF domain-containing protein [Deltaproteobacteria bacterium]